MPRLIQPSFAKGEISPDLHGRVDTQLYGIGLHTAKNTIIHQYGGASNRDGLRYLEPIKDHTKTVRLIPFQFNTTDQYVLEFGNTYIRVMRNDAHVLETATVANIDSISAANPGVVTTAAAHGFTTGDEVFITGLNTAGTVSEILENRRVKVGTTTSTTFELKDQVDNTNIDTTGKTYSASASDTATQIYELVSPYLEAELMELQFAQTADTMTITHRNHAPKELTRTDHDAWTLTDISFTPTIDDPTNVSISVGTAGSVVDRYVVTAIAKDTGEESLTGVNSTGDTISGATQANPVVITATAHAFVDGDEVEITGIVGMTELNGRRFIVRNETANTFELEDEDGTGHTAYTSGGTATGTFSEVSNSTATRNNTISWNAITGSEKYAIYRRENGVYGIIGETNTTSFHDDNIAPDTTIGPPGRRNPFADGNNPGAVTFFKQRRVFGGSVTNPDTVWMSTIGAGNNFNVRSPVSADDSITLRLSSREVNEIRSFLPAVALLTFTAGDEWTVDHGDDAALAPDTVDVNSQSSWGATFLPAYRSNSITTFVSEDASSVRTFQFSLELDGYTGSDLSLLARHLLDSDTIRDWTFSNYPESRFFITMDSGLVLTITFNPDQEVIAWTKWMTEGTFENVTKLEANGPNNQDSIYFVVKRTINGRVVRFIERWQRQVIDDVRDVFFVDCGSTFDNPIAISGITQANPVVITTATSHGLENGDTVDLLNIVWAADVDADFNETQPAQLNGGRYLVANKTATTFELTNTDGVDIDGTGFNAYVSGGEVRKAVTTISGYHWLDGETDLVALVDGNVVSGLSVVGSVLTLPRAGSIVHLGKRYISDLQTLDFEAPQQTIQGTERKINNVRIRFRNSRGLLVGPNQNELTEMKQRSDEPMGEPTRLLTGIKKIDLFADWSTSGSVLLRQKDPLPMTILFISPHFDIGDEE